MAKDEFEIGKQSWFEIGKQPCNAFKAPRNTDPKVVRFCHRRCYRCSKMVQYCTNCRRLHHEDGWENCVDEEEEN